MNFIVTSLAIFLLSCLSLSLFGCGEKESENQSKVFALGSEITLETELPAVLTKELTPEEKSKLASEIMPPAPKNEPTAEEKFLRLKKEADAGNAIAQNGLGVLYFTGAAISKDTTGKIMNNDPATAAAWFHRSALQGNAEAQLNLGLMYANGEGGLTKDAAKAVEFFQKAAAQGNADAQNNIGVMYLTGEGVPKSTSKAVEFFQKAAAQGNADAQANLNAMK